MICFRSNFLRPGKAILSLFWCRNVFWNKASRQCYSALENWRRNSYFCFSKLSSHSRFLDILFHLVIVFQNLCFSILLQYLKYNIRLWIAIALFDVLSPFSASVDLHHFFFQRKRKPCFHVREDFCIFHVDPQSHYGQLLLLTHLRVSKFVHS